MLRRNSHIGAISGPAISEPPGGPHHTAGCSSQGLLLCEVASLYEVATRPGGLLSYVKLPGPHAFKPETL